MPGGRAIKPGDVVKARNGKTIEIDNTDAEGRLILADALNYAETVTPEVIVDAATLTGIDSCDESCYFKFTNEYRVMWRKHCTH